MKKIIFSFFLLIFVSSAVALEVPSEPNNYVNDYAHLLSADTVRALNQKLQNFEQQTTNQIAVAIFPSLEGENLEDFSIRLAEQWKLGQKGKDNGVLLVIFVKDHRMRIETGYGLESVLPDALDGNILQQQITPYFKRGNYDEGVTQGVNAIINAIAPGSIAKSKSTFSFSPVPSWGSLLKTFFYVVLGFISMGLVGALFFAVIFSGTVGIPFAVILWSITIFLGALLYYFVPSLRHPVKVSVWRCFLLGFGQLSKSKDGKGGTSSSGRSGFRGGGGGFGGGGASGGW